MAWEAAPSCVSQEMFITGEWSELAVRNGRSRSTNPIQEVIWRNDGKSSYMVKAKKVVCGKAMIDVITGRE